MYQHIIYIDLQMSLGYYVLENVVYHCLKSGWQIGESKEHNYGFEKSVVGFENSLLLVAFFDVDVIVAPSDVHFCKDVCIVYGFNNFPNEREWVAIFDCHRVEFSIVLYWS